MQGAALVKRTSALAWQHINLYGRKGFRKQPELSMWTKSLGNWLKSGSEPAPLWRRDPGLNLFGALCKNPQSRFPKQGKSKVRSHCFSSLFRKQLRLFNETSGVNLAYI